MTNLKIRELTTKVLLAGLLVLALVQAPFALARQMGRAGRGQTDWLGMMWLAIVGRLVATQDWLEDTFPGYRRLSQQK